MNINIDIKTQLEQVINDNSIVFSTTFVERDWIPAFKHNNIYSYTNANQNYIAFYIGDAFFMSGKSAKSINSIIIRQIVYYLFYLIECGYSDNLARDCTDFVVSLENHPNCHNQ